MLRLLARWLRLSAVLPDLEPAPEPRVSDPAERAAMEARLRALEERAAMMRREAGAPFRERRRG